MGAFVGLTQWPFWYNLVLVGATQTPPVCSWIWSCGGYEELRDFGFGRLEDAEKEKAKALHYLRVQHKEDMASRGPYEDLGKARVSIFMDLLRRGEEEEQDPDAPHGYGPVTLHSRAWSDIHRRLSLLEQQSLVACLGLFQSFPAASRGCSRARRPPRQAALTCDFDMQTFWSEPLRELF